MEGLLSGEVHTEDCGLREEGGILMYPPVPLLDQYNVLGITLFCGSLALSPLYTGGRCVPGEAALS